MTLFQILILASSVPQKSLCCFKIENKKNEKNEKNERKKKKIKQTNFIFSSQANERTSDEQGNPVCCLGFDLTLQILEFWLKLNVDFTRKKIEFHYLTNPSVELLATFVPSGENLHRVTGAECPLNTSFMKEKKSR